MASENLLATILQLMAQEKQQQPNQAETAFKGIQAGMQGIAQGIQMFDAVQKMGMQQKEMESKYGTYKQEVIPETPLPAPEARIPTPFSLREQTSTIPSLVGMGNGGDLLQRIQAVGGSGLATPPDLSKMLGFEREFTPSTIRETGKFGSEALKKLEDAFPEIIEKYQMIAYKYVGE